jgi:hypothetical protein
VYTRYINILQSEDCVKGTVAFGTGSQKVVSVFIENIYTEWGTEKT